MKFTAFDRPAFVGAASLLLTLSTHAALTAVDLDGNPANGHEGVYDDVLDITWLADANLAASNTFGVGGIDASGTMTWTTAETLIDAMNADNNGAGYLGVNTWRQAAAGSCTALYCGDAPVDTDDELSYHYYQNFGTPIPFAATSSANATNLAMFSNMQNDIYWTGTEYDLYQAQVFDTRSGGQYDDHKVDFNYVWPVAPGNVAANAVPVPGAVWLFGSGLAGLVVIRKRR